MIAHRSNIAGVPIWRATLNTLRAVFPQANASRAQPGQALIELALSITFVFLLLGAAVDLGLMYKSYQSLINATAEASTYLDYEPKRPCGTNCDQSLAEADAQARLRFRNEQGGAMGHVATTLDLNSNGKDDYKEPGGTEMVKAMVRIDAADNTQIDAATTGRFGLKQTFNPAATAAVCRQRVAVPLSMENPLVTSCYLVIRSEIIYRPFLLRAVLGDVRIIRAISVRRIVK